MPDELPDLAPIDAAAARRVIESHSVKWSWTPQFAESIAKKLTRGGPTIAPLDAVATSTIVSMCREGWGLAIALKGAGITQRRYFAWIAKAHSSDTDRHDYREFRDQLRAAFIANAKDKGIGDVEAELNRVTP